MTTYTVVFSATLGIEVEAETEEQANKLAREELFKLKDDADWDIINTIDETKET